MITANLFEWLHGAEFYQRFHREAVDLLPSGAGRTWLDVGCGPGVLSREAALRGYHIRAVDRQSAMIEAAKRQTRDFRVPIDFVVSDLDAERARGVVYDVVSASSLLTVLPDSRAGLAKLAALAKPDGSILIIEASHRMTPINALGVLAKRRLGARAGMLLVWATARLGRVPPSLALLDPSLAVSITPLLDSLVEATILRKPRYDRASKRPQNRLEPVGGLPAFSYIEYNILK